MNSTRPVGITVICILISISLGLIPLWWVSHFIHDSVEKELLGLNLAALIVNAAIAVGIIVAAFFTWKGKSRAKNILIALVWIHVLGIAFNNAGVLLNPSALGIESLNDRQMTKLLMNIGRAAIWLVLVHWYFNTQKAKEFLMNGNS